MAKKRMGADPGGPSETEREGSKRKGWKHLWMTEKGKPDPVTGEAREFWTKIGVAFENSDGSFALHLKAFPMDGRVVMREPWPVEGETDSRPQRTSSSRRRQSWTSESGVAA